jgi:hypothetical protein
MENGKRKEFLNLGILGGDAGVPERRGFRAIKTDYIGSPEYNGRFFETFPTTWASAYAFRKALAAERQTDFGVVAADDEDAVAATEEWMSLFLLHYFGTVRLVEYKREDLEKEYDKDLWLALSGTYPSAREGGLASVSLLETNEGTVVGAYYPDVIFFPSRGRSAWARDETLQRFLVGSKLSWDLARRNLLTDERKLRDFQAHLARIPALLPNKVFKERVVKFLEANFFDAVDASGELDPNPSRWEIPGNMPPSEQDLLARYPLAVENTDGGKTYYLVAGMPFRSEWMKTVVVADCTPLHYRARAGDNVIGVQVRGRNVPCQLGDKDKVVVLKDLFLADQPYWCKVSRASDSYTTRARSVHRVDLRDNILRGDEFALCLAPIRRELLAHFPSLFQNAQVITATPDLQRPSVEWTFHLAGFEVRWQTSPMPQAEMPKTTLALWPPRVSSKWRFYVAYGTGSKEACGRWHLVDENGAQGHEVPLETDDYISLLPNIGRSNQPRALLFTDNRDRERGILFLGEIDRQNVDAGAHSKATLAVDFGTSNTCVAFKRGETSEILRFGLSPLMLWGQASKAERPGFVPFRWGGKKGFFPTILLSRRSAPQLEELKADEIRPEHLFKVDIPGLHNEMEFDLLGGKFNAYWETHFNMKWDLGVQSPWRPLFLGVLLLYAHAELFFIGGQGAEVDKYAFTYPLAFSDQDRDGFHTEAKKVIGKVRHMCYGTEPEPEKINYFANIDESTAIARAIKSSAMSATMEVFIDVGGGTADIAVRNGENFLVLDSIKVAGNTFFRFAKRNLEEGVNGAEEFKSHLRTLFGHDGNIAEFLDFGTFYSCSINRLASDEFKRGEGRVIKEGMGTSSYQQYRTLLFFRHVLTYALLQACAAAVDGKLTLNAGLKLVLGGNAWGLMMFAGWERKSSVVKREAEEILTLLKRYLAEAIRQSLVRGRPEGQSDEELEEQFREHFKHIEGLRVTGVELLNEDDLSKAKTAVALGALMRLGAGGAGEREGTRPFTGVTLERLEVNHSDGETVRWHERWAFEEFRRKFGSSDEIKNIKFEVTGNLEEPFDPVLTVFTLLGNSGRRDRDNMPGEGWHKINGALCEFIRSIEGNRLGASPINHFVSSLLYPQDAADHDFLDTLAKINGNYKKDGR